MAQALPLDAWVMQYFRVLPTDERFKALTEDAKIMLFEMMLSAPTEEEVRGYYRKQVQAEAMKVEDDSVKKEMESAGIDVDAINQAIDSGEFVKANAG